jgi:hypothetical protein
MRCGGEVETMNEIINLFIPLNVDADTFMKVMDAWRDTYRRRRRKLAETDAEKLRKVFEALQILRDVKVFGYWAVAPTGDKLELELSYEHTTYGELKVEVEKDANGKVLEASRPSGEA